MKKMFEEVCRAYNEFRCLTGRILTLQEVMEQDENGLEAQIISNSIAYHPVDFADVGGKDRDISQVRYKAYSNLRDITCYVEDSRVQKITFSVLHGEKVFFNETEEDRMIAKDVTLDEFKELWVESALKDETAQIIRVFEKFLEEHNIVISNEEKTEAVAYGEDPGSISNIYGLDYGWLEDELLSIIR